jgi:hypothetical protein
MDTHISNLGEEPMCEVASVRQHFKARRQRCVPKEQGDVQRKRESGSEEMVVVEKQESSEKAWPLFERFVCLLAASKGEC